MEETRRGMFKVAKTIVKMKDDIFNNKSHGTNDINNRRGSNVSNNSSPNK
jgi:hypothetical protein